MRSNPVLRFIYDQSLGVQLCALRMHELFTADSLDNATNLTFFISKLSNQGLRAQRLDIRIVPSLFKDIDEYLLVILSSF